MASNKNDKRAVSFRFSRQVIGLLEQYARDNGITKTEAAERAIKELCREGNTPATQKDIQDLKEVLALGFASTKQAIENQPIAALEQSKKGGRLRRLFGLSG